MNMNDKYILTHIPFTKYTNTSHLLHKNLRGWIFLTSL